MADMGVTLFQVTTTPTANIYNTGEEVWLAPGVYDYTQQEAGWRRVLEACPDARLCLRLFIGSPEWWDAANPDELQRGADGCTHFTLTHTSRQTVPSVASEKWRDESGHALRRFLDWLKTSGWSERIWGFLVCAGITYEWGLLGGDTMPDVSAPMVRRFRRYLKEFYTDECSLRLAWNDNTVTFETAVAPSRAAREAGDGDWRQFPRDQAAFDFQRCLSVANAEYLIESAQLIRMHGAQHYRIGAFYGYTLTAREGSGWSVLAGAGGFAGGHHALGLVLKARVLDYLASPYAYGNRDLGSGTLVPHFPWATVRHHGVQLYMENDLWTFTNPRAIKNKMSVGDTFTPASSILHQRLAWGSALCRGESLWWFDLTHSRMLGREVSNYSDPAIHAELARQFAHFKDLEACRGGPVAQIALVIDEAGKDAMKLDSKLFLDEVYNALAAWAWCGAPFDVWLAEDATPETMRPYRLVYLFAPATTPARRAGLCAALVSPDRTLWLAPGTELADAETSDTAIRQPCAGKSSEELAVVARSAGVHLYAEAPVQVWASENLVLVHTREAGEQTLNFPGGGRWREFFSKVEVTDSFVFQAHDVRLFVRMDIGGADQDQTGDLVVANDALYQLSYCPKRETNVFGECAPASKHLF